MKISDDIKLDFDDVLLVPARSLSPSRKSVKLEKTYQFFHSKRTWTGIPIMAANMDSTGTFAMAKSLNQHNMITCLHKYYDIDQLLTFFNSVEPQDWNNIWVSIGMRDEDYLKLFSLIANTGRVPNICIDIANGYTEKFVDYCRKVRENIDKTCNRDDVDPYLSPIIMAGNICTPEMVQELIIHGGVDIVKVGIGPGSACTTRLKAGVGYPQLSAIMECAHAAHGLKNVDREKGLGLICGDGGCRRPCDVGKAFAGGADFVMLGGMLAGTDECDGEWEYVTTRKSTGQEMPFGPELDTPSDWWGKKKKYFKFYGMSSKTAQEKYNGGLATYKASEGRVKEILYKGPVDDVIQDICGGIVSACSYVGATCLKDLPKCAKAVRVNRQHFDTTI